MKFVEDSLVMNQLVKAIEGVCHNWKQTDKIETIKNNEALLEKAFDFYAALALANATGDEVLHVGPINEKQQVLAIALAEFVTPNLVENKDTEEKRNIMWGDTRSIATAFKTSLVQLQKDKNVREGYIRQ